MKRCQITVYLKRTKGDIINLRQFWECCGVGEGEDKLTFRYATTNLDKKKLTQEEANQFVTKHNMEIVDVIDFSYL